MAKKRAKSRGSKQEKKAEEPKGEPDSSRKPRRPRRRKGGEQTGRKRTRSSKRYGYWTLVGVIFATFILMIGWYVNSRMAEDFDTGGPVKSESGQYDVKLRIMSQHHSWSTQADREVHTTGKVSFLLACEKINLTHLVEVHIDNVGWIQFVDTHAIPRVGFLLI